MDDREKILKGFDCCHITGSCHFCPYWKSNTCVSDLNADAMKLLQEHPEQKHGHWIPIKLPTGVEEFGYKEYTVQEVTCSECKFIEDVSASAYLYCPNCGAKMNEAVKQDD